MVTKLESISLIEDMKRKPDFHYTNNVGLIIQIKICSDVGEFSISNSKTT